VKFKLVAFDLDGVLVEEPSAWWTLHHAFGTNEASKKNLQAYEVGNIDYPEFMRRDISLWGTRKINEVENVLFKFNLSESAPEICDLLHQRRYELAILSAGIDILARAVSRKLKIEHWIANGLEVGVEGVLTGEGIFRVDLKEKDRALKELIRPLGIPFSHVVAVGDSKYDVSFMRACGAGIAFVKCNTREESQSWIKPWPRICCLADLPKTLLEIEESRGKILTDPG
jgi:HAD superfamily PSPase-like hydrolase